MRGKGKRGFYRDPRVNSARPVKRRDYSLTASEPALTVFAVLALAALGAAVFFAGLAGFLDAMVVCIGLRERVKRGHLRR